MIIQYMGTSVEVELEHGADPVDSFVPSAWWVYNGSPLAEEEYFQWQVGRAEDAADSDRE